MAEQKSHYVVFSLQILSAQCPLIYCVAAQSELGILQIHNSAERV